MSGTTPAPSGPAAEAVRLARIALGWLVEPGSASMYDLVHRCGPVEALERLVAGDTADVQLREAAAARLRRGDPRRIAETALARADRLGARIAVPEDDDWPPWLDDLVRLTGARSADTLERDVLPPLCLWARGGWPLAATLARSVAVVGARAATEYGTFLATELGYGLASREWTVVSGGAFGIDAAAHRGAITAGGVTVGVLACGVDRPYPVAQTSLFDRIAETGLLVSEWPPGAEPHKFRFLVRNRVIAALTRGTVVVEAAARSGALQTARRAIGMGRRTMIMPGPVTSAMSVGCHELLRNQPAVRLVTGVAHVLEEVGTIGIDLASPARGPEREHDKLDAEALRVLDAVPARRSAGPDQIAAAGGLDIRTTLRQLALLDELGFVDRRDDGFRLRRGRRAGLTAPPAAPTFGGDARDRGDP